MLTIPFITLLTQELHEEYLYWLHHKGTDEENTLLFLFLKEVEQGSYEVSTELRTEVDLLAEEIRRIQKVKMKEPGARARAEY